jgi:hypothetical protein
VLDRQGWADGRSKCQSVGGDLAIMFSDAQLTDVHAYNGSTLWVGANHFTGMWLTIHGAQPFIHWASGEPNDPTNEPCMSLNGSDGLLHDSACDDSYRPLCQY